MSERLPNNHDKVTLCFGDKEIELTPQNSEAYVHEEDPEYDHIFFATDEEDGRHGTFVWRQSLSNFDDVVIAMSRNGIGVHTREHVHPGDRDYYFQHFGYPPIPELDITPRQERRAKFLDYLLEHDLLTALDFETEGEVLL